MTTGGIEWEQGSAVTGMVEAIRANDPDAMGRSMADYAAALGTRTTSILSGLVAQVLTELHDMRAERSSGARTMDHKLDLILDTHEAMHARLEQIERATMANELSREERLKLIDTNRRVQRIIGTLEQIVAERTNAE